MIANSFCANQLSSVPHFSDCCSSSVNERARSSSIIGMPSRTGNANPLALDHSSSTSRLYTKSVFVIGHTSISNNLGSITMPTRLTRRFTLHENLFLFFQDICQDNRVMPIRTRRDHRNRSLHRLFNAPNICLRIVGKVLKVASTHCRFLPTRQVFI